MKNKIKELRVKIDGLAQLVKELRPFQKWRLDISKIPDGLTLEQHLEIFKKENIDLSNSIEPIPNQYKELEKTYDSLILAKAWLGKVLQELGEKSPYKNDGKRKTVEDIEETADTCNPPKKGCSFEIDWSSKSHIEKVDWLREEIKELINIIQPFNHDEDSFIINISKASISGRGSWIASHAIGKCNDHLLEARFWLGFDLQRVKENEQDKQI